MNKIIKTASIVTSGIIVGALLRKFAFQGMPVLKKSYTNPVKNAKDLFNKSTAEDINNYFV